MKRNNTFKLIIMAMAVVINIVGAFVAATLKLPIFIDTIGTFLSAFLFGPISGMLTGIVTALINGLTFDPYSLYFMPVQLVIGIVAGVCYKKNLFKGKYLVLGILITTVIGSIVASIISAFVFGGITSSGTSFIVMYLKEAGVNIVTSIFSTQIIFDLVDKAITVLLVLSLIKALPNNIKINNKAY
ncbi:MULTISPECIES: ECF transporter S component [unclassified Clostridium]|uniref:ECF transporter S component n=1 Tax=Clostridium TaxID=1485 RepID=UPI001C8B7740|nr:MULTISPECIES: ECF transporter S component [unclassified Clostridium]MBX9136264.1 ECF transporter S component [Clostridium sp. K12(2020)]MBX9143104.1 ECF transporter S component [Clostridium sp. K13]MDU2289939.1 ECF transporter S component [Clostridium celatum]MDU4326938.1 ECF transporter S component [Clostridium celatum]